MCSQDLGIFDLAPQQPVYSRPFNGTYHLDALHSSTFANEDQYYVPQLSAVSKNHEIYTPESIYTKPFNDTQHIEALHSLTFENNGQLYMQQTSADLGHHKICSARKKLATVVRFNLVKFLSPLIFWFSRLVNGVVKGR